MDAILDVLKHALRPASVNFFILLLAIGVVLTIVRRSAATSLRYFGAMCLGYWVFSTPACAERLTTWSGQGFHPLLRASDARGANIVVVLGSGNQTVQARGLTLNLVSLGSALRVLEGARLYGLLDHPTIIVSGGITGTEEGARPESEAMREAIMQVGVPSDHVVMESEAKTTREEALVIARMLGDRAVQPIVLVTSPTHMPRALAAFLSVGFDPVPSTAAYKSDHAFESYRWLPTQGALLLFDLVVYDAAARLYYSARGWTPK